MVDIGAEALGDGGTPRKRIVDRACQSVADHVSNATWLPRNYPTRRVAGAPQDAKPSGAIVEGIVEVD
jgi:hypothetical protein